MLPAGLGQGETRKDVMKLGQFGMPVLLATLTGSTAAALELPGIFLPSPLTDGRGYLAWGNDAFGPAGGSRSDDFRTNQVGVGLGLGPVLLGFDHSILTTANPTQAPVYWGLPDPKAATRVGAMRVDEMTVTVGGRWQWQPTSVLDTWVQAGAGVMAIGNLQGEHLQNGVHAVIAAQSFRMPYEASRLRLVPLGYGAAGGQVHLVEPAALWVGSVVRETTLGHLRWQHEALVAMTGAGGGWWTGGRWDGVAGEATTATGRIVDDEESGPSLVSGMGLRTGVWGVRLETQRNLSTDAQDGRFALTWTDMGPGRAGSGTRGWGRVGLLPQESRVAGRGLDYAYAWDVGPVLVMAGLRDNELSNHFIEDMRGHRHLLWAGVAQAPVLGTWGPVVWQGWGEVGAGWRHAVVRSQGFLTLDNERVFRSDAAIARAAIGGGPTFFLSPGTQVGVLGLLEGVLASKTATTTIAVRDPYTPSIIRRTEAYPVEGSAVGVILAAVARWTW